MSKITEVLNKAWDDGYKFASTLGLTGKSKKSFELWEAEILASLDPWISVEDGLPEEWEDKLFNIYCPDLAKNGWEPIMIATFTDEILFHSESYGDCHNYVTHYFPISEPK